MTELANGTQSNHASPAADIPGTPPPAHGPRRTFIHLALVATVLFTLITVGMLGWRWARVTIPDMTIAVRGDATAADTEVVVNCDDDHREIARGKLAAENNYTFVVMVERHKRHSIRATYGTTVLLEGPIAMPGSGDILIMVKMPPELRTPPATAPAAQRSRGQQPP
jgi:hypothetical protein